MPLGALLAAAVRGATVAAGFGRAYAGDVLGEEQWAWLEAQLNGPAAAVTVVVSSVQVALPTPARSSSETCPVSTEGGMRRVQLVREGRGRG